MIDQAEEKKILTLLHSNDEANKLLGIKLIQSLDGYDFLLTHFQQYISNPPSLHKIAPAKILYTYQGTKEEQTIIDKVKTPVMLTGRKIIVQRNLYSQVVALLKLKKPYEPETPQHQIRLLISNPGNYCKVWLAESWHLISLMNLLPYLQTACNLATDDYVLKSEYNSACQEKNKTDKSTSLSDQKIKVLNLVRHPFLKLSFTILPTRQKDHATLVTCFTSENYQTHTNDHTN